MRAIRSISSVLFVFAVTLGASSCGKTSAFCRLRQQEARADLNALHEEQNKFRQAHGRFARSMDELNFTAPDPNFYDVSIVSASNDTYSAKALGKRSVQGDEWTIDQLGNPVVRTNVCQ